ncbi:uncharacterized protein LOC6530378 [Drosophila yakuba]|uniref:Odorant-binding protein 50c n=1 Tax=Drosophila yakuba TaxID=7245 RepID=B4P751_DROYA|nr:uncharacterized protein LOC6530378 [Drosophila yakuba]EDW91016.1 Odorant-binding protein 50c [Drosophila yakuba]
MARQIAIALLICSLVAMASSIPIDVDCTRRQDFNVVKDCCAYPTFRFDQFKSQCGKYMPVGAPRISPCLYECIFNATNTVVNGAINPDNARLMLEKLFGNQDFEEVYFNGLMGCSDSVQEMLSNRRPRPQGKTEQCSPFAIFYGFCAQRYVFNHCPSSSWSGTESCEMARLQNMNCAKPSRGSSRRLL